MKWIKYKIEQSVINEQPILIDKKIGYSEDNLTIAQAEAYNGEYEIEEDGSEFESKPLPVELGGTGEKSLDDVKDKLGIKGFVFKGVDPLNSTEEDTPAFWKNLGSGIWEFTGNKGIPVGFTGNYGKGTLIQTEVANNKITQLFISSYGLFKRSQTATSGAWSSVKGVRRYYPWTNVGGEGFTYTGSYSGGNVYGKGKENVIELPYIPSVSFVMVHTNCITDALIMSMNLHEATWVDVEGVSHIVEYYQELDNDNKILRIKWRSDSVESQKNVGGVDYQYVLLP